MSRVLLENSQLNRCIAERTRCCCCCSSTQQSCTTNCCNSAAQRCCYCSLQFVLSFCSLEGLFKPIRWQHRHDTDTDRMVEYVVTMNCSPRLLLAKHQTQPTATTQQSLTVLSIRISTQCVVLLPWGCQWKHSGRRS